MLHKFKKPVKWEGQEVNEIELNLDDLTTRDYEKAEKHFKTENPGFMGVVEMESGFLKIILHYASGKPVEFFESLKVQDFIKVKSVAQAFLMGADVTTLELSA